MLLLKLAHKLLGELCLTELSTLYVDYHVVEKVKEDHKKSIREGRL